MSKRDEETFVVELPMRLYDYQDLIVPLLEAVAKASRSIKAPGEPNVDYAGMLADEIVQLLHKAGTDRKNSTTHGLVVLVVQLLHGGRRSLAERALAAACADVTIARRMRAFFASLPEGERPEPIELWPDKLRTLLLHPHYSTLGPTAAWRIAQSDGAKRLYGRLRKQLDNKAASGQIPRGVCALLAATIVLCFGPASAAALGFPTGAAAIPPTLGTATDSAARRVPHAAASLGRASLVFAVFSLSALVIGSIALWQLVTSSERVPALGAADAVDAANDTGEPASEGALVLATPLASCSGDAKTRKKCLLSMARRQRSIAMQSAVASYEASLVLEYEPRHESLEDSASAWLEMTSLYIAHREFGMAYSTYQRYIDWKPMPGDLDSNDCSVLFALGQQAGDAAGGLARANECQRSGLKQGEPPFWGRLRSHPPICRTNVSQGLELERQGRHAEAYHAYLGGLINLFEIGEREHFKAPYDGLGDWNGLGCESPTTQREFRQRMSDVGRVLEASDQYLSLDEAVIVADPAWPRTAAFIIFFAHPDAYGCSDMNSPIVPRIDHFELNGRILGHVSNPVAHVDISDLAYGYNEIVAVVRFTPTAVHATGCVTKTVRFAFCRSMNGGFLPPGRCQLEDAKP